MLATIRGFKDFIMRGNVIDLSVGIVIGAAFTALVGSFTDAFIKPLLDLFGANGTEAGGSFTIRGSEFQWSLFVNGMITFVITAAVLYFLVVTPMNKLAERRRKGIEPEPKAPSEEVLLLTEIRDALRAGAPATVAAGLVGAAGAEEETEGTGTGAAGTPAPPPRKPTPPREPRP